jgi:hypothetical protein
MKGKKTEINFEGNGWIHHQNPGGFTELDAVGWFIPLLSPFLTFLPCLSLPLPSPPHSIPKLGNFAFIIYLQKHV